MAMAITVAMERAASGAAVSSFRTLCSVRKDGRHQFATRSRMSQTSGGANP